MDSRNYFTSVLSRDMSFVKDLQLFKDLTGSPLKVYHASPLEEFSSDNLQDYAHMLNSLLDKRFRNHDIQITLVESMPFTPPAIEITIYQNNNLKYHSFFITLLQSIEQRTNYYPLLLVFPLSSSMIKTVHKSLEKIFSCSIREFEFHANLKHRLLAISINELIRRRDNEGFSLTYEFMRDFSSNAFMSSAIKEKLWQNHLFNDENKLHYSDVDNMFVDLHEHLQNTYGIDFGSCTITSASFSKLTIKFRSTVEMFVHSPEVLFIFLVFFNGLLLSNEVTL